MITKKEYQTILQILDGREPNEVELGIFSVMWSEHCSYKSTRKWLSLLPTKAPWVICGPGENAGVIDIGDGLAAIFKIESHNHPSFIEPYQGAATGVGGILRDIFTMGARPIALLNSLRFGDIKHKKTRYLVNGVVGGIAGYGNAIGVPTVGGEAIFHKSYNGNILVNAMAVGIAAKDKIFYSAANSLGSPVIYVGSKTGRDGIHGATMASAEFDSTKDAARPTVQVGDPFTEKLLVEACLELMATDAILSIQDMGAAGLTCSSIEMADKGGRGIELNLDKVPLRDEKMTPYEIMLSESQERMLMVLKPSKIALAAKIFAKWELDFAEIGVITDSGRMVLKSGGEIVANIPIAPLSQSSPLYMRDFTLSYKNEDIPSYKIPDITLKNTLKILLSTPDLADKNWIHQQYDKQVMNDTIDANKPADAALVRIHGSNRAIAMTVDATPRYVAANAIEGAKQAVAETYRNICAVGARPLAITNCLNFGNPEKPEIMGQIAGSILGIAEAARVLDYPVISGNVSLYNETDGIAIQPSPTIGGVGILEDLALRQNSLIKNSDEDIYLVLPSESKHHLGASLYLREICGIEAGNPPEVNLFDEKKNGEFVRLLIEQELITSCHDISDGGLLVAIAEMLMPTLFGAKLDMESSHEIMFGEDQARYVITSNSNITILAQQYNIRMQKIGITTSSGDIEIGCEKINLIELKKLNEEVLSNLFN